ncbi:MAG: hypothetical protein WCL06_08860 [Bacteroidota bacterium]
MKPNKVLFSFFLLFLFISVTTQAQSYFRPDTTTSFNTQTIKKNNSLLNYKRMSFSVDVGFGFAASKYSSGAYTYISPYMSYLVTPRFKLDVGGILQQGFNGFNNSEFSSFGGNGTNALLFVRGNYLVSDRLIISGSVYKTFTSYKTLNSEFTGKKNSLDNYGINIGAEYKISEHMTIGAQVNFSNGNNNPFYNSESYPYGGMQSNFHQNRPFGNSMMGW